MSTTVVVTGLGTTSPLGGDTTSTWTGMLDGRSGVRALTQDWAQQLPVRIAGTIAVDPAEVLERVRARRLDPSGQYAVIAATEAWADSGLADGGVESERLGVAVATGIGGVHTLLSNHDLLNEKGPRRVSPLAVPMLMPNSPAANVGLMIGAKAGVHTPVSACASGNEAISLGIDMIRLGRADVVVAGGSEAAIHPLPMSAFSNMMALSKRNDEPERASRPWDVDRDGFVLGEGSAIIVLEREEHAKARGAKIYAVAAGAGITADAHDIAQPDPAGLGATRAIRLALRDSDLVPNDIVHINAHATSTPQGDVAECLAITNALDGKVDHIITTSTKSMTGHLLGGAGALESLATILALHYRVAPPTINLENMDPAVNLDIATKQRPLPDGDIAAVNNSFGFGGHNVAVAFRSA